MSADVSQAANRPVWQPTSDDIARANLTRFIEAARSSGAGSVRDFPSLYDWSIHELERFWTDHLASIKQVAEQKAKQLAAHDRAASTTKPHSKEQHHGH